MAGGIAEAHGKRRFDAIHISPYCFEIGIYQFSRFGNAREESSWELMISIDGTMGI
jgi:hypothetical protein